MFFENLLKLLEMVASDCDFLGSLYYKFFGRRVIKEIQQLQIKNSDNILQIGCGALPYTAETIAKYTGAKVVAIDNDPKMVFKARSYIQKKRISNVQIEYGDGADFPLEKFNVIYISLGVYPLAPILKKIIKEGKGKKVIFRTSANLVGILYNKSAFIRINEKILGGRIRKSKILKL